MASLIAYMPVFNDRHKLWFLKHPESDLFLISQAHAERLLPRLVRNIIALPTNMVADSLRSLGVVRSVSVFSPELNIPDLNGVGECEWFLPNEDISHLFVKESFANFPNHRFTYDDTWARWDMTAVAKSQLVVPDVITTRNHIHQLRMSIAQAEAGKSPDWWRQIGAIAFDFEGNRLAVACNTHMPNEYETYILGDPRLNVDVGQKGKYCAIHAERAVISLCARYGFALMDSSMYVTTFPCEDCAREIVFAGISKLYFQDGYSVLDAQRILSAGKVEVIQVLKDPESA